MLWRHDIFPSFFLNSPCSVALAGIPSPVTSSAEAEDQPAALPLMSRTVSSRRLAFLLPLSVTRGMARTLPWVVLPTAHWAIRHCNASKTAHGVRDSCIAGHNSRCGLPAMHRNGPRHWCRKQREYEAWVVRSIFRTPREHRTNDVLC